VRKTEELLKGCMAKALPHEMTFVLLSRDGTAPATIRFWVRERLRTGKNQAGDAQIVEALTCAEIMEHEGRV
jgi:hypothetical protein